MLRACLVLNRFNIEHNMTVLGLMTAYKVCVCVCVCVCVWCVCVCASMCSGVHGCVGIMYHVF